MSVDKQIEEVVLANAAGLCLLSVKYWAISSDSVNGVGLLMTWPCP